MKRKYQRWGDFLKEKREQRYRSAREFCARASVGISYPQYSRYEAGDQLPHLELTLKLCKLLDVPALEGILEWNLAQVEDPPARGEIDALLEQIRNRGASAAQAKQAQNSALSQSPVSLDDIIVFNRSHLKLLQSSPVYRDIFTYINSFAPEWIAAEEIAQALEIDLKKLEAMLDELNDLGILLLVGNKCRTAKGNFYYPDDQDFFDLRNQNFIHNASSILKRIGHEDLVQQKAFRGLLTRELTLEQLQAVYARSEELTNYLISLPETSSPEKIYSFCLLLGERFARPKMQAMPGLRRELPKAEETVGIISQS